MSDHFYPLSIETLLKSSELVASAGLPFVIGEIGWTKEDTLPFLEAVEVLQDDGLVAGDLFWSMFGHAETLGKCRDIGMGQTFVENLLPVIFKLEFCLSFEPTTYVIEITY